MRWLTSRVMNSISASEAAIGSGRRPAGSVGGFRRSAGRQPGASSGSAVLVVVLRRSSVLHSARTIRPPDRTRCRRVSARCARTLRQRTGGPARRSPSSCRRGTWSAGAVGPAEVEGLLGRLAGEQAVDEARREAVAAADAVDDVELARRAHVLACRRARPRRPSRGRLVEWTSRSVVATILMLREAARRPGRSCSKNVLGSSFDSARTSGPGDPEALLQVLLVADEDVDVLDDRAQRPRLRPRSAARRPPRAWRGSSGRTR